MPYAVSLELHPYGLCLSLYIALGCIPWLNPCQRIGYRMESPYGRYRLLAPAWAAWPYIALCRIERLGR